MFSYHLGFEMYGLTKYVQEKKSPYVMKSAEGDIVFTGADELDVKSKFQQRILASTNIALSLSKKDFEVIKSCYKPIIEDIIVSRESTIETRMKAWITEYLDGKTELDQHDAAAGNHPFVHKGQWHVFLSKFKEWAFRSHHDRDGISKTEFDMKKIGAEEIRFNPKIPLADENEKGRTTRRAWCIPLNIIIPKGPNGI